MDFLPIDSPVILPSDYRAVVPRSSDDPPHSSATSPRGNSLEYATDAVSSFTTATTASLTFLFSTRAMPPPLTSSDPAAARIRENQRRSRARKAARLSLLESRLSHCRREGIRASTEVQLAARRVLIENELLREMLRERGDEVPIANTDVRAIEAATVTSSSETGCCGITEGEDICAPGKGCPAFELPIPFQEKGRRGSVCGSLSCDDAARIMKMMLGEKGKGRLPEIAHELWPGFVEEDGEGGCRVLDNVFCEVLERVVKTKGEREGVGRGEVVGAWDVRWKEECTPGKDKCEIGVMCPADEASSSVGLVSEVSSTISCPPASTPSLATGCGGMGYMLPPQGPILLETPSTYPPEINPELAYSYGQPGHIYPPYNQSSMYMP